MRIASLLCALALALPACDGGESIGREAAGPTPIRLQFVSFSEWEQVLAGLKGDIGVIDVWASWCAPCIERFPHMVEMHHRYRGRGVRFVSLNLDEQGDTEALEWAERFLRETGAAFPNYHMDENMLEAFERLGLLALPVVLIRDTGGREAYRLTGDDPNNQFDEADVEAAIRSLLEAGTAAPAGP